MFFSLFLLVPLLLAQTHPVKKHPVKHVVRRTTVHRVVKSRTRTRTVVSHRRVVSKRNVRWRRKPERRVRGQQKISPDRAREIQSALIREHYLDGQPSGEWDQKTKEALARYQSDNGWQTKYIPDARALIKLGLGPSHDGLLNPNSAAFASPNELGVQTDIPGGAESH